MNKLIIYVSGGLVQSVYSTDPDVQVIMVDQDKIEAGDPSPIHWEDMELLHEKSTENCRVEIKAGKFFNVY